DPPADISESFTEAERAQPPSPQTSSEVRELVQDIRAADVADQIPAVQHASPIPSALPEFAVDIAEEADESEPVSTYFESPLPVGPVSATGAAAGSRSGSRQASEQEQKADDILEAAVSARPQRAAASESPRQTDACT